MSDVNDETPIFSTQNYKFTVSENSAPGESVGTVQATDSDLTNLIRYNISQATGYNSLSEPEQIDQVGVWQHRTGYLNGVLVLLIVPSDNGI